MIKTLIKINSVTGSEQEIQKYILNLLASFSLKPLEYKGNVAVLIKGAHNGNCVIFNSHTDTVSPGDASLWQTNPFEAVEKGGKIYGLGVSDNKSSVAVLLMLAKKLAVEKPACDVILTFTVGEEVDGHGTNDIVKLLSSKYLKVYKNISTIVCEPTGLNKIGLAHKGNIFIKITTKGKSGHGSHPIDSKDHAVLKMNKIIGILEVLGKKWNKKYKNKILGSPTIGLATSISAGSIKTPNKFPDTCVATFDIRTTPEMHNVAFGLIKKAVKGMGKVEYLFPPVPYAYTKETDKIAKVFKSVTKKEFMAFPGSTDMPFFTGLGIPTIIFGPGEINQMHKPNEFCYSKKIGECTEIFLKVISGYNE